MEKNKYDHWFNRDHLKKNLKNQSVKGGVSTVAAQGINFIVSMLSTVILARLLMPADFGMVAMVTAVTGFVLTFNNLGLGLAVVQREHINQKEVSQLFWFNMIISFIVALIIVGLSPVLANFYHEPRLLNIGLSYALIAVFGGLGIIPSALLRRQMRLKEVASIGIWSNALSVITGIIMAYAGFGYWAIVALNCSNEFYNVILKWIRCDWRPDWLRIDKDIKEYVGFGANISGFNLINYFSRNADNILIGKYIGSATLGLYTKAYQLLMLPLTQLRDPLNTVVIPGLSSLKNEPERFRSYYRKYLFMFSFFSMPLVVFLGICSYPVIIIVLGQQWIMASDYFTLLAVVGFIQGPSSTIGVVLISFGQTRRFLHVGIWKTAFTLLCFFVGIQWGIYGLLVGYIVGNYVSLYPFLWHSFAGTPVKVKDFFKEIMFPGLYALTAGLVTGLIYYYIRFQNHYVVLVSCGIVFAFSYFLLWRFVPYTHKLYEEVKEMGMGVIRSFLRKIKPKK